MLMVEFCVLWQYGDPACPLSAHLQTDFRNAANENRILYNVITNECLLSGFPLNGYLVISLKGTYNKEDFGFYGMDKNGFF